MRMLLLGLRTTELFLRRMTRTTNRPRARRVVYAGLAGALIAASGLATWYVADAIRLAPLGAGLLLPVFVLAGYLASGPTVLVIEGARDKSGAFERALAAMPLRPREVQLLVWAPFLIALTTLSAAAFAPLASAFAASGLGWPAAIGYAAAVTAVGMGTAAVALLVTYAVLRGPRWMAVRTPTAMLVWLALTGVLVWATIRTLADGSPVLGWAILPQIVADAARVLPLAEWTLLGALAFFVVGFGGFLLVALGGGGRTSTAVRLGWGRPFEGSMFAAEAAHTGRVPVVVGNLLAAVILNIAIIAGLLALDPITRTALVPAAAAAILISAGVGARLPRSAHPPRPTPAQLIGADGDAWFMRQFGLGVIAFLIAATPVLALLPFASAEVAAVTGVTAIGVLAVNQIIGWTVVVPLDDPLGQLASGVLSAGAGAAVAVGVANAFPPFAVLVAASAVALLVASVCFGFLREGRRWRHSV